MFSAKIFILLACSLAITMATPVDNKNLPGSVHEIPAAEIKELQKGLQVTLNQLATGDAPHYEIFKVNSASKQVVAGVMIKMNVDLVNTLDGAVKTCDVSIWSRPWIINGIETTIKCEGQKTLVESHSA